MKKYVEIKPIVLREWHMVAERVEKRIDELQKDGYKVLSVAHSSFASTVIFLYRKTIWKAIKDWLTKPISNWEF